MKHNILLTGIIAAIVFALQTAAYTDDAMQLQSLKYNNPGLVVDLGVGLWAWPIPFDVNDDGHVDLIVNCDDKPYNGVYIFLNTGEGPKNSPIFAPAKRISHGTVNVQPSYIDGKLRVMSPGKEYPDFLNSGLEKPVNLPLPANVHPNRVRGNMWRYVDFDGDGKLDIIVGVGDWTGYGWDNAYDENGKWLRDPLHGRIYFAKNNGEKYDTPVMLNDVDGNPLATFGWPCPNFADWDNDGDLDILCGEFRDGFNYFENIGTRTEPRYKPAVKLSLENGEPLVMDLQMITPVAFDWDKDGDLDLVCGDEDGRVALLENTGKLRNGKPLFLSPNYFRQQADELKCGALATPYAFDWDCDGDYDIISGNTAGYIMFYENLSGSNVELPKWAAPKYLEVDGRPIRIMAGENGSIQGPAELKWGYTTLTVADWDHDNLPDLVVNSIWGKVVWYKNIGTRTTPKLADAQPIEVEWEGEQLHLAWGWLRPQGKALLTQWRTTPIAFDWNKDGLLDLLMLDHEGYFCFFERTKTEDGLKLLPPQRVFVDESDKPIRLNEKTAGGSGRRKIVVVDYDGDGAVDILANSTNAELWRQTGIKDGKWFFKNTGNIDTRPISGHTTSPCMTDFNGDGIPDPLIGAEDGRFYYKRNVR